MTATTVSTPRIAATATYAAPGFGATLRSEWTKLASVRSTWIVLSLAIGLSIGFSAVIALISGLTADSWNADVAAAFDPVVTPMSGLLFGCILQIVLAVSSVTSEYSSGMIRTTLIGNPRRNQVFAAKTTIIVLLGLGLTTIIIPTMFLVSQPIYRHYGLQTASITDSSAYQTLLTITITQGLIYMIIPFAIAWLLRGTASSITVALGFLWLPWMLGPVLPTAVKENVVRYLPDMAANSLSGLTKSDAAEYLGQTPAMFVIAAWLVGSLIVAAVALNRRDV